MAIKCKPNYFDSGWLYCLPGDAGPALFYGCKILSLPVVVFLLHRINSFVFSSITHMHLKPSKSSFLFHHNGEHANTYMHTHVHAHTETYTHRKARLLQDFRDAGSDGIGAEGCLAPWTCRGLVLGLELSAGPGGGGINI